MNKWLKRLSNWFLQIENEVMVPFVLVGILVIGSFSMISYYNGYTMQKNSELELADTLFEDVNRDLNFLEKRLPEEEIAEKYRNFERGRIRILNRDGEEITAGSRWKNTSVLPLPLMARQQPVLRLLSSPPVLPDSWRCSASRFTLPSAL